MPLRRAAAVSIALVALAAPVAQAQQAIEAPADIQRGKKVFRTTGGCVNCHGWAADGKTGISLKYPPGSSLRESTLDVEMMIEVIRCGRPGTEMPYHDRSAYRDDRCYGLTMSDFDDETRPMRGKAIKDQDVANIVGYLQTTVVGRGTPTFEECVEFFDNPDAHACKIMK